MRKNFVKKMTAVALSLSMIIGSTGIVSAAHAANGANIASTATWSSFSVRDDLHNGGVLTEWEESLLKEIEKAKQNGDPEADNYQSYTEGYFTGPVSSDGFEFYVKNSGWDGEYYNGNLVADNPWGMTIQTNSMEIEKGRSYTISFKIKSTLTGDTVVTDENGAEVKEKTHIKHIGFKAYDTVSRGGPAVDFDNITGATPSGIIELDSTQEWQTVTAQITIPKDYGSTSLGVMFALGARMVTYQDEVAMKGYVYLSDFTITAGNQYTVTFEGNGTKSTSYVNQGATVSAPGASLLGKKGYTIDYYTLNGSRYNFGTPVTSNITLSAHYAKTAAAAKPKISSAKSSAKKKVKVTIKKANNAVGYQVKYSYKKNMKAAKTKTTAKTTYTIKKLKSGKLVFIQVRGYNTDDLGNKVFGKWSAKKKTVVR